MYKPSKNYCTDIEFLISIVYISPQIGIYKIGE